jgi:hypothetical protein
MSPPFDLFHFLSNETRKSVGIYSAQAKSWEPGSPMIPLTMSNLFQSIDLLTIFRFKRGENQRHSSCLLFSAAKDHQFVSSRDLLVICLSECNISFGEGAQPGVQ